MTEVPLSTRIPKKLEIELDRYMDVEHLEKSSAIRKLLHGALQEWREKYALQLLADGKVTVSKGAQIAGLDIWDFIVKIKESKIVWVSDEVVDEDLKDFK